MRRVRSWLAARISGTATLLWRLALVIEPPYVGLRCLDCKQPEPECWCDEEYERDHMFDGIAAEAGAEAYREGYRDAENEWREPNW